MEGGVYPWKRQRPELDGVVYADYTQILKPLPPPPDGLAWVKRRVVEEGEEQEEGSGDNGGGGGDFRIVWELVEKPARPGAEEGWEEPLVELEDEQLPGQDSFIEHTVLPTDTMAGLRLRYKGERCLGWIGWAVRPRHDDDNDDELYISTPYDH
jgi:hypothetical protein